mmetsp:Transcript_35309/g.56642  ORF Transcript_35309/g.56642 Transcript_35309/m.56642 type:complete len:262 (-) Transcript_35309:740-1525(-)|eukprot:CAMPEP_0197073252 /NCGR_PEP_ID=MMETSP1384-20130603/210512_1 /TAXON_ID=29189 /ORGANISM="Ammonia sp." /LENGTH=261 /DNA_ID=CAMNT_0042512085 /DNA_START=30 /DNA_END=815 /DNA_ORIENTATION=+
MASCEQLCNSCSSEKAFKVIAGSPPATYLVVAIAAISAVIGFVLSVTQLHASDGMGSSCTDSEVIELLSPWLAKGTRSDGVTCEGYCPWPRNNTSVRLAAISLFIVLMVLAVIAMQKQKRIWLVRFCLFITLTLLFTALVQDFHSLIAGKKACENGFKVKQGDEEYPVLTVYCVDEEIETDSCPLDPYVYMIFADLFAVTMCAVLWQLIAYVMQAKAEMNRAQNMIALSENLEQPTAENQSEGGNAPLPATITMPKFKQDY